MHPLGGLYDVITHTNIIFIHIHFFFVIFRYQQLQDDMTKDPPTSTEVVIDGVKVEVVYRPIMERHLLLVGASASISSGERLARATDSILPALTTAFGSEAAAFGSAKYKERVNSMFSTMFKQLGRVQGRLSASAAPSALLSDIGAVAAAECSKDERLEISDTLGMLETNGANAKLERTQACIAVGTCIFIHGVSIYNDMQKELFAATARYCEAQGLTRATVDTTLPLVSLWSEVFDSETKDGHGTFLLLTAFNNTVMATRMRAWHGAGRSRQAREPGPDPAQVHDAALKMHMLHVNGTLARATKRLPLSLIQRSTTRATLGARAKSWPLSLGAAGSASSSGLDFSEKVGGGGKYGKKRVQSHSSLKTSSVSGGGGGVGRGAVSLQDGGAGGSFVFDYVCHRGTEGVACFDTQEMPRDPLKASVRAELQQQFYNACSTIRKVLMHPGTDSERKPRHPTGI